jgi:hypothetical protein
MALALIFFGCLLKKRRKIELGDNIFNGINVVHVVSSSWITIAILLAFFQRFA